MSLQDYINDVKSGKTPAGLYLRLAIERFERDLQNPNFEFREKEYKKVLKFISKLRHFTDKFSGKPFILEPWQEFIIANLYGFFKKGTNERRFQSAYIEIARKNGKTALIAALALYHLIAADDGYPEILIAANSKDQAKIGFTMTKGFSEGYEKDIPEKNRRIRRHHSDINYLNDVSKIPETDKKYRDRYIVGFIKNLASDSSKLDGYNCSLGIIDEYHSAKNSHVRDVIRSSQAMRTNPLLITITTAGFDKSSVCYELHTLCADILSDQKQDESLFTVIYSLDEGDNWQDQNVWIKSNPNLDVTVKTEFIQQQVQQAINSPADEVGVKTKNLNIWCDSMTVWIPDDYVIQATKKLNMEDFHGETCYCGVDLASNTDLTAVSYMFYRDEKYYFFVDYYLPADTLRNQIKRIHADKNLYQEWYNLKALKITSGNVTDYDYITHDILKVDEKSPVQVIYYDKYNATSWAIQCTEAGLNMFPFSQVISNFNSPTREFERAILSGNVIIDDNPITRYCIRNVELRRDFNGNVKPLKDSEKKKIDGVIAMLQALEAYTQNNDKLGSQIY